MNAQLQYENFQVLSLIQAMLGAVSNNMRAVSLRCDGKIVHLYFLLAGESAEDRKEIEDIVAEWEALQETNVPVQVHVMVSNAPFETIAWVGRQVFLQRQ